MITACFELEIECISALSTLEYIDFKQEGATVSLLGIIKSALQKVKGIFGQSTYQTSILLL